jgi:hypothetical protein
MAFPFQWVCTHAGQTQGIIPSQNLHTQQLLPDLVSLADLPVCSSADFSVRRSQRES